MRSLCVPVRAATMIHDASPRAQRTICNRVDYGYAAQDQHQSHDRPPSGRARHHLLSATCNKDIAKAGSGLNPNRNQVGRNPRRLAGERVIFADDRFGVAVELVERHDRIAGAGLDEDDYGHHRPGEVPAERLGGGKRHGINSCPWERAIPARQAPRRTGTGRNHRERSRGPSEAWGPRSGLIEGGLASAKGSAAIESGNGPLPCGRAPRLPRPSRTAPSRPHRASNGAIARRTVRPVPTDRNEKRRNEYTGRKPGTPRLMAAQKGRPVGPPFDVLQRSAPPEGGAGDPVRPAGSR